MKTRKKLVEQAKGRYRKAQKKGKGQLLNEFIALTNYNRCYAARVLRQKQKRPSAHLLTRILMKKRGRKKKYTQEVLEVLKKIWGILNFPCGKRLVGIMPEMLAVLRRHEELILPQKTETLLQEMSACSVDRLLANERKSLEIRGRSGTKPGSLLKHKIPIRTFADWDNAKPGFLQIDLVGHEGGNSRGDFCQTLDTTDVATGWTEPQAIRNKAQKWVYEALQEIRKRLPFPLLGINSDSGSEFINAHLWNYCKKNHITFTRGRQNKKNDNCYIEQKNYTAVRQTVGYYRYDTQRELELLNKLYRFYRLYANFFLPQMKLIEKTREGSKVKKKYDRPLTPYARALASRHVASSSKDGMKVLYLTLNPLQLRRDMLRLQNRLYKLASSKHQLWLAQNIEIMEHPTYAIAS